MRKSLFAAVSMMTASPLLAQGEAPMITANDPAGIIKALDNSGYETKMDEDSSGDPMIITELSGMPTRILFYGCDGEHLNCDALQFSTGFDRPKPWNEKEAIGISSKLRFAAISLDDEGDPYITWDIVTGDGIPLKVFLKSLRYFAQTVTKTAGVVFADED